MPWSQEYSGCRCGEKTSTVIHWVILWICPLLWEFGPRIPADKRFRKSSVGLMERWPPGERWPRMGPICASLFRSYRSIHFHYYITLYLILYIILSNHSLSLSLNLSIALSLSLNSYLLDLSTHRFTYLIFILSRALSIQSSIYPTHLSIHRCMSQSKELPRA